MTGTIVGDFMKGNQRYYVIADDDHVGNEIHICKVISVTRDDFRAVEVTS